jgi:hypothetical protein
MKTPIPFKFVSILPLESHWIIVDLSGIVKALCWRNFAGKIIKMKFIKYGETQSDTPDMMVKIYMCIKNWKLCSPLILLKRGVSRDYFDFAAVPV